MQSKRPIIIGIAGGSGSGKTTIAHEIYDQLQQDDHILIMTQDSYYKNNDNLSMADRKKSTTTILMPLICHFLLNNYVN